MERRMSANPPGICPVDSALNLLSLCHAQSCGKCVPCRVGLQQLENLIRGILNGKGKESDIDLIEKTALSIMDTADCVIGIEAARQVLTDVNGFRDDYLAHLKTGHCMNDFKQAIPCVAQCPANVDIPGYVALVGEKRYADAIRLIRKDNPFPTVCAYICEHPCETHCRRGMVDSAINIRGIKKIAADEAGYVAPPNFTEKTGKRIAVIGGGPAGLTAAYYLSLMGHKLTVFEKRDKLGGMLRYGIPSYRLPREKLDEDIKAILSLDVEVKTGVDIGKDISIESLRKDFDALYITIGAHTDKKLGIDGESSRGVISAVEMLRAIGDGSLPDFNGKNVVVVGGGNVAMDCTRTSVRLGAKKVSCVYRRRQTDMTALADEVEGAIAEGAEMVTLEAPARVEADSEGNVTALITQPQLISTVDNGGRPKPVNAHEPERCIPADIIIVAIGQDIETEYYSAAGVPIKRGRIGADNCCIVSNMAGVFAGGDCVTGPATVIKAIAAGKVAAANIDEYLGYKHTISVDVDIPAPHMVNRPQCGRTNLLEREACDRKNDFSCVECGMSEESAVQEASRCLRCDCYGYGNFRGGRQAKW